MTDSSVMKYLKPDSYFWYARLIPTAITIIPLFLFHYFYSDEEFRSFINTLLGINLIAILPISLAFLIACIEVNRFLSKVLVEGIYFRGHYHLPTTVLLLHSNDRLSDDFKQLVRNQIKREFKITLPSEEEELANQHKARRCIADAVKLVREKVKHGRLLAQYNRSYGCARNLIGGSLIALPIALFEIYFFQSIQPNQIAVVLAIVLSILYLTLLLCSYNIMRNYGYDYAERLFTEYVSMKS